MGRTCIESPTVSQQDEYSNSKALTEALEQRKSNSWTPVGPTKDRVSSPNQLYWMFLGRSLHKVWGTYSTRPLFGVLFE